jgi:hypothetical protein
MRTLIMLIILAAGRQFFKALMSTSIGAVIALIAVRACPTVPRLNHTARWPP